MAPTHLNLDQTRRWLAQLHTANLPPVDGALSDSSYSSSTHSRGSGDLSPSSSSSPIDSSTSSSPATTTPTRCPLTESRARSLQRLCEISDVNAQFSPSNINYVKTVSPVDAPAASPTMARSRWSRKASGQSLQALEGGSMRRFSLSRFKLRQ